ncbi:MULTISPECIES: SMP-30/gluconolactonase/LRE family protein [unclassified Inquilinus]|uniref:SMP-30/gluconolactonase/LRE family protein n=1 Tax=unclassified Inquilinus TaxID=2645927 RepID=UPI003F8DD12C
MILDPILDLFRGKAVTIPPMDGAFRPDTRLDEAPLLAALPEPDTLASIHGTLVAGSGNALFTVAADGGVTVRETFPAPVTAVAVDPAGDLVVGLETGRLVIGGQEERLPDAINCITALAFGPDGTLWLANGSAVHSPSEWAADLMGQGASGSLWKREAGTFRQVAGDLAFPCGLLADQDGVLVSESWRHRLVRIDGRTGARSTVVDQLPGYPATIAPAAAGGAWLCLFAPRNRLVEFVLQETEYRREMMQQVPPAYWIAPSLSSGRSFLEPLQCGGIRTMGLHKPWAPSRSYGMVVRLDADHRPVSSLHSRAGGQRHGTRSAVEHGGRLVVAAKGGDCLVAIDIGAGTGPGTGMGAGH